jgi:hypothetical protein
VGREGRGAAMPVAGCPAGDGVLAVLPAILVPPRRPGQGVLREHRTAQAGAGGATAGAAAGVRLRSLPPDAPAVSPREACWSKGQARVRAKAARTLAALEHAMTEAVAAITAVEAQGGFAHAGYGLSSN